MPSHLLHRTSVIDCVANGLIKEGSRLRREDRKLFINGSLQPSGIQSINLEYETNLTPTKFIGQKNYDIVTNQEGAQQGSVSVNYDLISNDWFFEHLLSGFNGYIVEKTNKPATNFSFESGFISSYSASASIGEVPSNNVEIDIFGNIGKFSRTENEVISGELNNLSNDRDFPLLIPGPGSMELSFDELDTNRLQSYDISIDVSRTAIYSLGNRRLSDIKINFPITVNVTFNVEVDDLQAENLRNFPCKEKIKNLEILQKDYLTDQKIMKYKFHNLFFVGESRNLSTNTNLNTELRYIGFVNSKDNIVFGEISTGIQDEIDNTNNCVVVYSGVKDL